MHLHFQQSIYSPLLSVMNSAWISNCSQCKRPVNSYSYLARDHQLQKLRMDFKIFGFSVYFTMDFSKTSFDFTLIRYT